MGLHLIMKWLTVKKKKTHTVTTEHTILEAVNALTLENAIFWVHLTHRTASWTCHGPVFKDACRQQDPCDISPPAGDFWLPGPSLLQPEGLVILWQNHSLKIWHCTFSLQSEKDLLAQWCRQLINFWSLLANIIDIDGTLCCLKEKQTGQV